MNIARGTPFFCRLKSGPMFVVSRWISRVNTAGRVGRTKIQSSPTYIIAHPLGQLVRLVGRLRVAERMSPNIHN